MFSPERFRTAMFAAAGRQWQGGKGNAPGGADFAMFIGSDLGGEGVDSLPFVILILRHFHNRTIHNGDSNAYKPPAVTWSWI
jgi:hypothetical protein